MKRFLGIFVLLVVTGSIAAIAFYNLNLSPVSQDNFPMAEFVVNQGDGISTISQRLEKNKYVRNSYVFMLNAYLQGLNGKLQAGTFRLSPSLSTEEIVRRLSKGGSNDSWFKIVEGQRLEEFAQSKEFEIKAANYEGQLFPDSYLIPDDYTPDQIVNLLRNNFQQKLSQAKNDSTTKFSDSENLVLASLLEREGRSLESKQMIAGIIHNRLEAGIALQIDATVQYARDSKVPHPKDYWQPLSKNDLSLNSAYNTYKNPGLPPGPICNPGYNSLFAAYHPTSSEYLYYITGNDGKMHYARTLDEHNHNVSTYLR